MGWLATVWVPDADSVARVAPEWSRPALDDQGPYGRGTPFDLLIGGAGAIPNVEWSTLGDRVFAWSVDETAVIEADAVPAVTMVSLMRRSPALTRDEFVAHWLDRHAPLAMRRHIGLSDYRQLVVIETATTETPAIDGVALLGFASRSNFETKFFDSDEGRAEIMEDVARFMDRPRPETTLVGPSEQTRCAG